MKWLLLLVGCMVSAFFLTIFGINDNDDDDAGVVR